MAEMDLETRQILGFLVACVMFIGGVFTIPALGAKVICVIFSAVFGVLLYFKVRSKLKEVPNNAKQQTRDNNEL